LAGPEPIGTPEGHARLNQPGPPPPANRTVSPPPPPRHCSLEYRRPLPCPTFPPPPFIMTGNHWFSLRLSPPLPKRPAIRSWCKGFPQRDPSPIYRPGNSISLLNGFPRPIWVGFPRWRDFDYPPTPQPLTGPFLYHLAVPGVPPGKALRESGPPLPLFRSQPKCPLAVWLSWGPGRSLPLVVFSPQSGLFKFFPTAPPRPFPFVAPFLCQIPIAPPAPGPPAPFRSQPRPQFPASSV